MKESQSMRRQYRESPIRPCGAIALLLAIALTAGAPPSQAQTEQKPNILFIMGDDIGWMQPSAA